MKLDIKHDLNALTFDEITEHYNHIANKNPKMTIGKMMAAMQAIVHNATGKKATNEQLFFACANGVPVMCESGPGSGKTFSIEIRILKLIVIDEIKPSNIAVMMYSNQASKMLRYRIEAMIERANATTLKKYGKTIDGLPSVSTLHSFAKKWVFELRDEFNLTKAEAENVLLDDVATVFSQIYDELRETDKENTPILTGYESSAIINLHSYLSEIRADFDSISEEEVRSLKVYPSKHIQWEFLKRMYSKYYVWKRVRGKMDFVDILLRLDDLLDTREDIRERVTTAYVATIYDEHQDSSKLFESLQKKLMGADRNIAFVADTDQTLFGFRGADGKTTARFKKDYEDGIITALTYNRRCPQQIIDVANRVIRLNEHRFEKSLKGEEKECSYRVIPYSSRKSALALVMQDIMSMSNEQRKDTVICYRNSRSASYLSTNMFLNTDINFEILSGTRLFNDIVSACFLPVIEYPFSEGRQILKELFRYTPMSRKEAFEIFEDTSVKSLEDYYDRVCNKEEVKKCIAEIFVYRNKVLNAESSLCLVPILNLIRAHYLNYIEKLTLESGERVDDELFDLLVGYFIQKDKSVGDIRRQIITFLTNKNLNGSLCLSTIHGLKGSEFENVYIIDMDNTFPNMRNINSFDTDEQQQEAFEEEVRALYVALTRTKKNLTILLADSAFSDILSPDYDIGEVDLENSALTTASAILEKSRQFVNNGDMLQGDDDSITLLPEITVTDISDSADLLKRFTKRNGA